MGSESGGVVLEVELKRRVVNGVSLGKVLAGKGWERREILGDTKEENCEILAACPSALNWYNWG